MYVESVCDRSDFLLRGNPVLYFEDGGEKERLLFYVFDVKPS